MVNQLSHLSNIDTSMQSILGPLSNCRKEEKRRGVKGLMFPDGESLKGTKFSTVEDLENHLANTICRGSENGIDCPVRAACLEYARQNREHFGVWGGYGTEERERYFRRQRRQNAS